MKRYVTLIGSLGAAMLMATAGQPTAQASAAPRTIEEVKSNGSTSQAPKSDSTQATAPASCARVQQPLLPFSASSPRFYKEGKRKVKRGRHGNSWVIL